jgi:branched-chain amino acid transport system substrate-binding protein
MSKNKLFLVLISIMFAAVSLSCKGKAAKVLYVGGTMALTGAYAEDTKAVLAAYEDYVKYVNETHKLAPWRDEKFPGDIKLEVLWRDDELQPPKAISIYEELKSKGILVFRGSGSPQVLALKDKLFADGMGGPSMATGPYLLKPPQSLFSYYPIYTDSLAAVADWFKNNWKENRKPRVAYLTSDNAMGKGIEIPEMKDYLEKAGYEFVGAQYVPLIPAAPPTTQLLWLKKNKVDLALGVFINPNAQPTVKEMVRLGMGPFQKYKITIASATPGHLPVFTPAMGKTGDGYVCAGGFPPFDDTSTPGIAFINDVLQKKYRPDNRVNHIQYIGGLLEAMIQVEALRLAMEKMPVDKLTPRDVLENGFYMIKDLDTGGLSSTPLTYGKGDIEGVDQVRVDQQIDGKIVKQGVWPCHHLY